MNEEVSAVAKREADDSMRDALALVRAAANNDTGAVRILMEHMICPEATAVLIAYWYVASLTFAGLDVTEVLANYQRNILAE